MVDFYKLRHLVLKETEQHLLRVQEAKEKKQKEPPLNGFIKRLALEHGATLGMVRGAVETLVPGATVRDGEIVKKNEE